MFKRADLRGYGLIERQKRTKTQWAQHTMAIMDNLNYVPITFWYSYNLLELFYLPQNK